MKIPVNNQWVQKGDSDVFGTLWSSFCLNLTKKVGKLLVSPKLLINTTGLTGVPVDFKYITGEGWFTITGAYIYKSDTSNGDTRSALASFAQDATSNSPQTLNVNNSMEIYPKNQALYVSSASANAIYKYVSGTWSNINPSAFTGSTMKKIIYHRATNRMYMSYNGSHITSWDENDSPIADANVGVNQYSLNIGLSYRNFITTLVPSSTYIWILTLNTAGDSANIYYWDGSQASGPNGFVPLDAHGALAGVFKDSTLWVMDTKGRLMVSNGGAFVEKARLPISERILKDGLSPGSTRWIHPNGMAIVGGKIQMVINTDYANTDDGYPERAPSGVWEYDDSTGSLYHKYAFSYSTASNPATDYGQRRISAAGAIASATSAATSDDNGSLIVGATYFVDDTSTTSGIFYDDLNDTKAKYGSFVTTWIAAAEIKQKWQSVHTIIRKHVNSTDKITVKYRTDEEEATNITGTWASTSTFNTVTDLRDYVGYEVEILNGTGGGKAAHITTVTENGASGWLIALDDTFTGVTTGTFIGRVQNWTKAGSYTGQTDDAPKFSFLSANDSTRVQIKVCMEWTGKNELSSLFLNSAKAQ